MKVLSIVASNTFKETIRNKVLYNILLVAGVVLLLSISFGDLSVFSRIQVMTDFGLATMSLTGLLLAVFIGVGMLGVEISTKTVYGVITRPVGRASFILGKFTGLFLTLLLNFLLIAAVFMIAIQTMGGSINAGIVSAVFLILVEMAVIVSAAIFFSTFTTPTLAAIFTLAFYAAGHLNNLVSLSAQQSMGAFHSFVLRMVHYILPNLDHFNIRTMVVYGMPVPEGHIFFTFLYGVFYTALLLILSVWLFGRKDL
ncbi:ABC transporter permease subunit [Chitinispirillales bacterium ANBcel5]|uniref:ABC transporter permease subunit n=1 Tax=Cellulosispirillum alkaliphilum TaxID=3039283 RepID=UPI002A4F9923|nr:ABC transporter permease subunit [Chitinispirillales bacterium ANBcel5]